MTEYSAVSKHKLQAQAPDNPTRLTALRSRLFLLHGLSVHFKPHTAGILDIKERDKHGFHPVTDGVISCVCAVTRTFIPYAGCVTEFSVHKMFSIAQ